jgi:hypothetical protein
MECLSRVVQVNFISLRSDRVGIGVAEKGFGKLQSASITLSITEKKGMRSKGTKSVKPLVERSVERF